MEGGERRTPIATSSATTLFSHLPQHTLNFPMTFVGVTKGISEGKRIFFSPWLMEKFIIGGPGAKAALFSILVVVDVIPVSNLISDRSGKTCRRENYCGGPKARG